MEWIRADDGTVTVCHTGCEICQGINTKVAQTVAYELGIELDLIRVTSTSTEKIVNGYLTGGSSTSEVMCQAAINACKVLNDRIAPYRKQTTYAAKEWTWLLKTIPCDVSLNSEGWFSPVENPDQQPFLYFVWGACVSEVEMQVLTGEIHVLSSEITYGIIIQFISL